MKTAIALAALLVATAAPIIAAPPPDDSAKCLRRWDSTNPDFVALVKARLRNPASFAHRGTTTRTMPNGQILAKMAYSGDGKNGTALARMDPTTCKPTLLR